VTALIAEFDCTVTEVAGTPPTETLAPDAKLAPWMVICVPPWVAPPLGETVDTTGGCPDGCGVDPPPHPASNARQPHTSACRAAAASGAVPLQECVEGV
jgi:hypothetical protein